MERIVVVGAGTMGSGIALAAAAAGFHVDVIEPDDAARERAKTRIAADALRMKAPDAAARVQYFSEVPAGEQAAVAIEAVPEQMDLKRSVFEALARALPPDALLATNTSSLSVSEIAQAVAHPERVLGLHFFNPATLMKLVEIVRAEDTSEDSIERARSLVLRMNKTPIITADTPGFVVNRVARPYYLQALRALEAGVAPVEDLDALARGAGFRMGPFELMDLIGLEVNLATSDSVYDRSGLERLEPVATQRSMVAQERLGRKTGSGFYDYSQGPPARNDEMPQPSAEIDANENIVIIGYAGLALEMEQLLSRHYANVHLLENEEDASNIPLDATIVFDVGDGHSSRAGLLGELDTLLPPETVIFADAYATDIGGLARKMAHPERVVGYGILAALENQRSVEIVDAEHTSDDALELAQDLFETIGRRVVLVEDAAGLFLGRTIGSIVNEAVAVVEEEIATADDVDVAMRLGTNYPQGPIAWGREIGADRIVRILQRLAGAEGAAFAPHRALWVLDVQENVEEQPAVDETETNA